MTSGAGVCRFWTLQLQSKSGADHSLSKLQEKLLVRDFPVRWCFFRAPDDSRTDCHLDGQRWAESYGLYSGRALTCGVVAGTPEMNVVWSGVGKSGGLGQLAHSIDAEECRPCWTSRTWRRRGRFTAMQIGGVSLAV